jgi:hypothetical protein
MSRENPHQRYKFRRLADKFNTPQARIALLEQENAKIKARQDAQAGTKKRQAAPNPNKKFMSIHNILSKEGYIKNVEEGPQEEKKPEEVVVVKEEDIYGISNAEQDKNINEDIPSKVVTKSGREIRRPAKYEN